MSYSIHNFVQLCKSLNSYFDDVGNSNIVKCFLKKSRVSATIHLRLFTQGSLARAPTGCFEADLFISKWLCRDHLSSTPYKCSVYVSSKWTFQPLTHKYIVCLSWAVKHEVPHTEKHIVKQSFSCIEYTWNTHNDHI